MIDRFRSRRGEDDLARSGIDEHRDLLTRLLHGDAGAESLRVQPTRIGMVLT